MTPRRTFTAALVLQVSCGVDYPGGLAEEPVEEPSLSTGDAPPTLPAIDAPPTMHTCPLMEFVGLVTGEDCLPDDPDPRWQIEPLFAGADGHYLPSFCRLRWTGDETPAWTGVLEHFEAVEQDCPVVIPQGHDQSVESDLIRDILDAQLRESMEWGLPTTPGWRDTPIDIYVVDTVPEDVRKPPRSYHGVAMARLICDLIDADCDGDDAMRVINVLGMPRYIDEYGHIVEDLKRGGAFGTRSDLARGLFEAVEHASPALARKIILLAAGWNAGPIELGSLRYDSLSSFSPMRLLQDPGVPLTLKGFTAAAMYAACKDTTMIVAAGNITQDACSEQAPTGPAFLAEVFTPTDAECKQLGVDRASPATFGGLLTPVTSIGLAKLIRHDNPSFPYIVESGNPFTLLSNTRPGARAPLMALGVAGDPRGALIGSSVAAAVAASATALLMSMSPDSSGSWVVEQTLQHGLTFTLPYFERSIRVDFGLWPSSWWPTDLDQFISSVLHHPDPQVVSLCRVMQGGMNRECDADADGPIDSCADVEAVAMLAESIGVKGDICAPVPPISPSSVTDGCSATLEDELAPPWTMPQPRETMCPACFALGRRGAPYHVRIDPSQELKNYRALTLEAVNGRRITAYPVTLQGGGPTLLSIPSAEIDGATFRLTYEQLSGGSSLDDPMWIRHTEPLLQITSQCICPAPPS